MSKNYTFNYTINDLSNPGGNNNLSSRAKFFQRSLYKEAIYPPLIKVPRPLDTWYNKNLYGRVDRCQNTIVLVTDYLKQIRAAANPNIFCLNFVESAFNGFANHMKELYLMGALTKSGNKDIWNISAVLGYTDPVAKWKSFIDGTIDSFAQSHVDKGDKVIKNYQDFVPLFTDYLLYVATTYGVTQENFLLSNVVSPFISGLSISISRLPADNDKLKFEKFIADPNFDCYVKVAKKYGFIVNKNMPWILTADLFTDALQYYMEEYLISTTIDNVEHKFTINENNFFDIYYAKTYKQGFKALKYILCRGYTRFISQRPVYAEQKVIFNKKCASNHYREVTHYRQSLSIQEIKNITGDKFLIDLYTKLRYIESKESYPAEENIRMRAYEVYRSYIYPPNYGQVNPNLDLDSFKVGDIIDTGIEISAEPRCAFKYRPGLGHTVEDIFDQSGDTFAIDIAGYSTTS